MPQDRNEQLDKLIPWLMEGLSDEKLSTIAKISEFSYLASENKRKTVLYTELGYFYIFFIIIYLKNKLPNFSFEDRNYLLNSIQRDYFDSVDRNSWFESLNKKLKDYGRAWDSPTAGKVFGVVGLLMLILNLENKPNLPSLSGQINLTEFFGSYFELIYKSE